MRPNRPLSFDGLEGRQLLSAARPLGAPSLAGGTVHAMVSSLPLDLSGTLTVNPQGKQAYYDPSGDTDVSMPIRGTLAGVGAVRGFWVQSQDANGNLDGPDELQLRNAKGAVTISFNNPIAAGGSAAARVKANSSGPGGQATVAISADQHVTGGSKAYNHAAESGTVVLTVANSGRSIRSLVLATNPAVVGSRVVGSGGNLDRGLVVAANAGAKAP